MPIKKKSEKQKLKRKSTWVDLNDPIICQKILQKYYGSLIPTSSNPKNKKDSEEDKNANFPKKADYKKRFFHIYNDLKSKFFQNVVSKCRDVVSTILILEKDTDTFKNLENIFSVFKFVLKRKKKYKLQPDQKLSNNQFVVKEKCFYELLNDFEKQEIITTDEVENYKSLLMMKPEVKMLKKSTSKKINGKSKQMSVKDKESSFKKTNRSPNRELVENNVEKKSPAKDKEPPNEKSPKGSSPKKNIESAEKSETNKEIAEKYEEPPKQKTFEEKPKGSSPRKNKKSETSEEIAEKSEEPPKQKTLKEKPKGSSPRKNKEKAEDTEKNEEIAEKYEEPPKNKTLKEKPKGNSPIKNKEKADKSEKNKEIAEKTKKCLLGEMIDEVCQEIIKGKDLVDDNETAKTGKFEEDDLSDDKSTGAIEELQTDESNECNKVEVELNRRYKAFDLLFLELMKIGNGLNINETKAVITFNTKEAAKKFRRNNKLKNFIKNEQLVKVLPCEESTPASKIDEYSCNSVEVDIYQKNGNTKCKTFAFWYYCMSLISDKASNVNKTTAVITFNTEADAENFIKEEKLNDLVNTRRLVKTVACEPIDECNKVEVEIADKTGSYEKFLIKLMCDSQYNIDKSDVVITFKTKNDARSFKEKNKLQGIVEDARLVETLRCDTSKTQLKSSKGVSKRRKRKYRQIADQMTKAQMQEYHKRIKQLGKLLKIASNNVKMLK